MKAYKHLVKYALSMGCTVSVWDGEEWQVRRNNCYSYIIDAIESVEEAQIRIRQHDVVIGWGLVSAFGLEDDETVIDHSTTPFMKKWSETYEETI